MILHPLKIILLLVLESKRSSFSDFVKKIYKKSKRVCAESL